VGPSAPEANQTQPESSGAPFAAWLIDGDGVAIDGTEDFTDPVAFATAYAKAYADMFPPERKPFERANAEALGIAHGLDPEGVEAALNPPEETPPVEQVKTDAPELPLDAPHDAAVIPSPAKPTRAAFTAFNEALKEKLETATELQRGHIAAVNSAVINGMPNAFRMDAVALIEVRRKELEAAQQQTRPASPDLVEDLLSDVYSLTTPESVSTWLTMPRIAAYLKQIQATDRRGWLRIMSSANSTYVRMRVEGCGSIADCDTVENDKMVNGAMEWLHENDGAAFETIVAFAREHRGGLAT
jgi:hypothetical protein